MNKAIRLLTVSGIALLFPQRKKNRAPHPTQARKRDNPMAANIALTSSMTSMIASVKVTPWHKQGIVLPEHVTGTEMLRHAGMDWDVISAPLMVDVMVKGEKLPIGWDNENDCPIYNDGMTKKSVAVDGKQAVYRNDTGAILGITSDTYNIFQNREMVEVLDSLTEDGKMRYEVAGGLGNGERVWILAQCDDMSFNVKGDEMKQYITICSSHDGLSALAMFPTMTRIVCANTWRQAATERKAQEKLHGKNNVKTGFSIKHTKNMRSMVEQAAHAFAETIEANKFSRELYASLAEIEATDAMRKEFFNAIADNGKEATKQSDKRKETRLELLTKLSLSETNNTKATRGTAWGLFNVGTEYVNHYKATRCVDGKSEDAARFEASMFANGPDEMDMMLAKVCELAGIG